MKHDVERLVANTSTDGKSAKAPCGHKGVHYTRSYVACLEGCDRYNDAPARAKTEPGTGPGRCAHPNQYGCWVASHGQSVWCVDCGAYIRSV